MTSAYPLTWPAGRPRSTSRKSAPFNKKVHNGRYMETKSLTIADVVDRLELEIDRLGVRQYVISTNIEPRLDGRPRSGQPQPTDPRVALYFHLGDKPHCLPCDTYDRVADNIAAIAKHIEATRATVAEAALPTGRPAMGARALADACICLAGPPASR